MKFSYNEIGSSVSCSGACLTVEKISKNIVEFYVSKETLSRTVFKFLKRGDIINLEKSIKYGQRISGHFVQGHVDTVSSVKKIMLIGKSWLINFCKLIFLLRINTPFSRILTNVDLFFIVNNCGALRPD